MAIQIQGGPAMNVVVDSSGARVEGGSAIPVAVVTDGRRVSGNRATRVVVVSNPDHVEGGPAIPVVAAAAGDPVEGGPAMRVYVVQGSFNPTPAFKPSDLPLLALWLKADSLALNDGDAVGTWADQSINGYTATQAIAASKPTYKAAIIGALPVVRFDGGDTMSSASLTLGTTCSIYVVAKRGSGTGYRRIISNENNFFFGENIITSPAAFASFYGNGSAWGTTSNHGSKAAFYPAANTYPIVCSIQDGVNDTAYIDGTQVNQRANTMAAFSDGYKLGSDGAGGQFWDGDMCEILIYNTAHTAAQRQQVEGYLRSKWSTLYYPDLTFARYASNPVVALNSWATVDIANPDVFWDAPNSRWVMNYSGWNNNNWRMGLAYSTDLLNWTQEPTNPVFAPNAGEGNIAANGSIVYKAGTYYHYYQAASAAGRAQIHLATSTDLLTWTRANGGNAVIPLNTSGTDDDRHTADPCARLMNDGTTIEVFYLGVKETGGARSIMRTTSTDGVTFGARTKFFDGSTTYLPFGGGSDTGEPHVVFNSANENEYMITYDADEPGQASGTRALWAAFTLDAGATWSFLPTPILLRNSGWDAAQVFDSCPLLYNGTLYLFYAGSTSIGSAAGLGAQIGVATAAWPRNGLRA